MDIHFFLELQLKPVHKPYEVKKYWRILLEQYSHESFNRKQRDEPLLSFQRNIFFSQQLEEKIKYVQRKYFIHFLFNIFFENYLPTYRIFNN